MTLNLAKNAFTKRFLSQKREKAIRTKRLDNLIADLSRTLDNFILQLQLTTDPQTRNMLLISFYEQRQLDQLFFQRINQTIKQLGGVP